LKAHSHPGTSIAKQLTLPKQAGEKWLVTRILIEDNQRDVFEAPSFPYVNQGNAMGS